MQACDIANIAHITELDAGFTVTSTHNPLTNSHSLTLAHSLTLTSITHTHTHTHILAITHSHSLTHTHRTHTHSLTHTHSHSLTLTHSHSLTLTHTHSHTHPLLSLTRARPPPSKHSRTHCQLTVSVATYVRVSMDGHCSRCVEQCQSTPRGGDHVCMYVMYVCMWLFVGCSLGSKFLCRCRVSKVVFCPRQLGQS